VDELARQLQTCLKSAEENQQSAGGVPVHNPVLGGGDRPLADAGGK